MWKQYYISQMKYINPEVTTFLSFFYCVQMINLSQKYIFMTKIDVKTLISVIYARISEDMLWVNKKQVVKYYSLTMHFLLFQRNVI